MRITTLGLKNAKTEESTKIERAKSPIRVRSISRGSRGLSRGSRRKSSLTTEEESKAESKPIYSHPNTFDKESKNFRSHNVQFNNDENESLPQISRKSTLGLPPTPLKNKRKLVTKDNAQSIHLLGDGELGNKKIVHINYDTMTEKKSDSLERRAKNNNDDILSQRTRQSVISIGHSKDQKSLVEALVNKRRDRSRQSKMQTIQDKSHTQQEITIDKVDESVSFENPLDFAKVYKKQIVKSKTNEDAQVSALDFVKQYQQ